MNISLLESLSDVNTFFFSECISFVFCGNYVWLLTSFIDINLIPETSMVSLALTERKMGQWEGWTTDVSRGSEAC